MSSLPLRLLVLVLAGMLPSLLSAQESAGGLTALSIETAGARNVVLSGRDAGLQLVVTGQFATNLQRDLTHQVQYDAVPTGIVSVDKSGYVAALTEGRATVRAT